MSPIPTTVNTIENDTSGNQLSPESSVHLFLSYYTPQVFFPAATFFGSLFFDAGFASGTLVICSLSSDIFFY